ncbi:hypothetical protein [Variovorax sp. EL159]|uniref:hypothetical protein n=1 Tax=Variovorax sp. EL159 TaxID=1566270 RepID=UPI00115FF032|nr:hypothetical protein [Variovorax sp. EL159]
MDQLRSPWAMDERHPRAFDVDFLGHSDPGMVPLLLGQFRMRAAPIAALGPGIEISCVLTTLDSRCVIARAVLFSALLLGAA